MLKIPTAGFDPRRADIHQLPGASRAGDSGRQRRLPQASTFRSLRPDDLEVDRLGRGPPARDRAHASRAWRRYRVAESRRLCRSFTWLLAQPDFLSQGGSTRPISTRSWRAREGRPFVGPPPALGDVAAMSVALQAVLSPARPGDVTLGNARAGKREAQNAKACEARQRDAAERMTAGSRGARSADALRYEGRNRRPPAARSASAGSTGRFMATVDGRSGRVDAVRVDAHTWSLAG